MAETDDDVALKANYFSPGFRVLAHQNGRVTRARLEEVSLTGDPINPACRVLERQQHDPLIELTRAWLRQHELTQRRLEWSQKYLKAIPAALAVMAPPPEPPPARG